MSREMFNPDSSFEQLRLCMMSLSHALTRLKGATARFGALIALQCLMASVASAHPDIWIKVRYLVKFDDQAMIELETEWTFDIFFSSRIIDQFDTNRDRVFSLSETKALQSELFAPLADIDYFVRVTSDDTIEPMQLARFDAQINGEAITLTFGLRPSAPLMYRKNTIAFSTYDPGETDFSLADMDTVLVQGAFEPTCRFRIGSGSGALQGYPQTVKLVC